MSQAELDEFGGYAGESSIGAVFDTAGMGALTYLPDLQSVGSGSAGTYYPRDTSGDAAALNYLGFFPDPLLATHVGTTGTQQGDMAQEAGAWDPDFRAAVTDFQQAFGLGADGWIGPNTRRKLAEQVAAKNARGGDSPIPNVIPPMPDILPPVPVPPSPVPNNGPQKASTGGSSNLLFWGIGGALLLGGLAWALRD